MALLTAKAGTRRAWIATVTLALALGGLAAPDVAPAAPALSREYEVKAVFLYNFAQFVDWPGDAFASASDPLVIGILGEDPFGKYIDEAVRGERVNGRPIAIRRISRPEDAASCQILFISRSEAGNLPGILSLLKGKNVLTVSDIDGFSHGGGMIRFVMENNKVRLRINIDAARAAGLRISSKLLRPSEVVSKGGD
jgi:hypothetical protein